jgi:hypothetical protein
VQTAACGSASTCSGYGCRQWCCSAGSGGGAFDATACGPLTFPAPPMPAPLQGGVPGGRCGAWPAGDLFQPRQHPRLCGRLPAPGAPPPHPGQQCRCPARCSLPPLEPPDPSWQNISPGTLCWLQHLPAGLHAHLLLCNPMLASTCLWPQAGVPPSPTAPAAAGAYGNSGIYTKEGVAELCQVSTAQLAVRGQLPVAAGRPHLPAIGHTCLPLTSLPAPACLRRSITWVPTC